MYQCSLSLTLFFLSHWNVLQHLFSTLSDDWCALDHFCVHSSFQFLWQNLFPLSKFSNLPIVKGEYLHLRFLQKSNLNFQPSFRCSCKFFTGASFVLSSIWIFCNSLILVVAPWSNFWESSFSSWMTPLSFTITSFSVLIFSNCWKSNSLLATASSDIC